MRSTVVLDRPLGDSNDDVAELLEIYHACATFQTLPVAGGVFDQPARLMYLLSAVRAAYDEREALEQKKQSDKAAVAARSARR